MDQPRICKGKEGGADITSGSFEESQHFLKAEQSLHRYNLFQTVNFSPDTRPIQPYHPYKLHNRILLPSRHKKIK